MTPVANGGAATAPDCEFELDGLMGRYQAYRWAAADRRGRGWLIHHGVMNQQCRWRANWETRWLACRPRPAGPQSGGPRSQAGRGNRDGTLNFQGDSRRRVTSAEVPFALELRLPIWL